MEGGGAPDVLRRPRRPSREEVVGQVRRLSQEDLLQVAGDIKSILDDMEEADELDTAARPTPASSAARMGRRGTTVPLDPEAIKAMQLATQLAAAQAQEEEGGEEQEEEQQQDHELLGRAASGPAAPIISEAVPPPRRVSSHGPRTVAQSAEAAHLSGADGVWRGGSHSPAHYTVGDDAATLTAAKEAGWRVALGGAMMAAGAGGGGGGVAAGGRTARRALHYAEVEILSKSALAIFVGVGRAELAPVRRKAFQTAEFWGLGSADGKLWHAGRGSEWPGMRGYEQGDTVGLLLDGGAGTLAVYRNGEQLGVAARGLAGVLCWAVALHGGGDSLRCVAKPPPEPQPEPEPQPQQHELQPEPTAVEPGQVAAAAETDEEAAVRVRQALGVLRFSEVRQRAERLGVDEDTLDDAEEEGDPKSFLVAAIIDRLQRLRALRFKELKREVMRLGVGKVAIGAALEDLEGLEERKAAIVRLLFATKCTAVAGEAVTAPPQDSAAAASPTYPRIDWHAILQLEDSAAQLVDLQTAADLWHDGRWVVRSHLGRGGSGVVILAHDARLGEVALKFSCEDPRRLTREAALMQRVQHKHICNLMEASELQRDLFGFCLEYLNGGSFERVMEEAPQHRVRQYEVARMGSQVLQALQHMHAQGVIHRDVKPSNIMLHTSDEGTLYKVIDFGVSVIKDETADVSQTLMAKTITGLKAVLGTMHWMSPEQVTTGMSVDTRTDLWSLGVVFYAALCGQKPFGHDELDELKIRLDIREAPAMPLAEAIEEVGVVSEEVADFVSKALQKGQEDRFQTAAEMLEALEEALTTNGSQKFDHFISYRVWCDSKFADALFKALSSCSLREGREHRIKVYLDKVRLVDGQRFDYGFIAGLANSTVFGPLLTSDCMKSFLDLAHTDKEDFVLMEWMIAIELNKRGIVKAIFPIVVGEQQTDGTFSQSFFEELRDGKVNGQKLPDIVSVKTTAKAREFLSKLDEPLELSEVLTVKGVVDAMLQFQAILHHFENDKLTAKVDSALNKGGAQVRVGSSHGHEAQRIGREHVVAVCAERIAKVVIGLRDAARRQASAARKMIHQPGATVTLQHDDAEPLVSSRATTMVIHEDWPYDKLRVRRTSDPNSDVVAFVAIEEPSSSRPPAVQEQRHLWQVLEAESTSGSWRLAPGSKALDGVQLVEDYNEGTEGYVVRSYEGHPTLQPVATTAPRDLPAAARARTSTCCICYDEFDVSAGIECDGSDKHFCCKDCFARYIESKYNKEDVEASQTFSQLDALAERQGNVFCPFADLSGCEAPSYTMEQIHSCVPGHVFFQLLQVKDSLIQYLVQGDGAERGDASPSIQHGLPQSRPPLVRSVADGTDKGGRTKDFPSSTNDAHVHEYLKALSAEAAQLKLVSFSGCRSVTDVGVRVLAVACPQLTSLNLSGTSMTDEGLRAVAAICRHLSVLYLNECSLVTAEGVHAVAAANAQLTRLSLKECSSVTDEGIRVVAAACPQLTWISLRGLVALMDEGLRVLAEKCTQLTEVSIYGCSQVTDEGVCAMTACLQLTVLHLGGCTLVTDKGVREVAATCSQLTVLGLDECALVTDEGICAVAAACTKLIKFQLSHCSVTDVGLCAVAATCPQLKVLTLDGCGKVTDEGLRALAACVQLTHLNLNFCSVTDDGLRTVAMACSRLTELQSFGCSSVTDEGLRALQGALLDIGRTIVMKSTQSHPSWL
eukprot:COSAG01_NODE_866_length_13045_cov_12.921288_6_plen_1707_part_00